MQVGLNSGMSRPPDTLAARLKLARARLNMTQGELADRSGMKQPDISKMERGVILKTTGIARIASTLGVEPEWLELGNGPMLLPSHLAGYAVAESPSAYQAAEVAHALSQRPFILSEKPRIWEELVKETIRGQFRMAVKGEALLPNHPAGQMAIWEAGDHTSVNPGQAALLWLPGDRFELRFIEQSGNAWAGVSQRFGYGRLEPDRDGAEVVARLRYPDLG